LGQGARSGEQRLGISQEELASRAGMHWTYLSDLERGRQTPTLDLLNRVARPLGVTLADFFLTARRAVPGSLPEAAPRRASPPHASALTPPYTHGIGHVPAVVGVIA